MPEAIRELWTLFMGIGLIVALMGIALMATGFAILVFRIIKIARQ